MSEWSRLFQQAMELKKSGKYREAESIFAVLADTAPDQSTKALALAKKLDCIDQQALFGKAPSNDTRTAEDYANAAFQTSQELSEALKKPTVNVGRICPRCNGSGRVLIAQRYGNIEHGRSSTCTLCGGKGRI